MSRDDFKARWSIAKELLAFFWHGRTWWLTPIIVVLLLMTGLMVFLQTSALAPFIYTLF